jgi:hypothetical protein
VDSATELGLAIGGGGVRRLTAQRTRNGSILTTSSTTTSTVIISSDSGAAVATDAAAVGAVVGMPLRQGTANGLPQLSLQNTTAASTNSSVNSSATTDGTAVLRASASTPLSPLASTSSSTNSSRQNSARSLHKGGESPRAGSGLINTGLNTDTDDSHSSSSRRVSLKALIPAASPRSRHSSDAARGSRANTSSSSAAVVGGQLLSSTTAPAAVAAAAADAVAAASAGAVISTPKSPDGEKRSSHSHASPAQKPRSVRSAEDTGELHLYTACTKCNSTVIGT